MKRQILMVLIVIFVISSILADPYSGSNLAGSSTMTLSSDLSTIFKQGSTDVKNSLAIGYTLNKQTVTGETIIPIANDYRLVLTESVQDDGQVIATGSIYAYFRVASLYDFSVKLKWNPLTNTTDPSQASIGLKINNLDSNSVFYSFDPSNGVMDDHRLLLLLSTVPYSKSNHSKTWTYTTEITMTITTGV